jgi:hypothetical protein
VSKEIEDKVDELLASWNITCKGAYSYEKRVDLRLMDAWVIHLFKGVGTNLQTFEFCTGLGQRKLPPWGRAVPGYDNGPPPRPGCLLYEQWEKLAHPVAPHAASVLHSLILDSEAATQTFESWCGELGYDTDSRKAFATYEACQQEHDKLMKVFTHAQIEQLREALQDY